VFTILGFLQWQQQHQYNTMSRSRDSCCPLCRVDSDDMEAHMMKQATLLATEANLRKGITGSERRTIRTEAVCCLDKVLTAPQPTLQAYFTKAEILLELGGEDAARDAVECTNAILQKNKERNQHPVLLLLKRQDEAMERGDYEEYERLKDDVVKAAEEHGMVGTRFNQSELFNVYFLQRQAYEHVHDWKSALASSMKALECMEEQPRDPVLMRKFVMGMARCFYEVEEYDKAVSATDWALEMNRHFPGVHKYKALSYERMGKLDLAIEVMNQAVLYEAPWDEENQRECVSHYYDLLGKMKK
jgi:tetratricopeptide (TPR) repeat protein